MNSETMSGIKCKCGGRLKRSFTEVEFFGIDFGVKQANVCIDCGSEYLSQEVMEEVESELKKRGEKKRKHGLICGKLEQ